MTVNFRILPIICCIFVTTICFGNQARWPQWLSRHDVVTLHLDTYTDKSGRSINAIQLQPVSDWIKEGSAILGYLEKDGQFKPKSEVKFSEYGPSEIRLEGYIINSALDIKDQATNEKVGSAVVLKSSIVTVLKDRKIMPEFDVVRQYFPLSNKYVLLEQPIKVDGVKVSALYFESYSSTYPGSQVYFGNLNADGEWVASSANSRAWSYSSEDVIVHLDSAKSKYLEIQRGSDRKSSFLVVPGKERFQDERIKLSSLALVSQKEYFFKKPRRQSKLQCAELFLN